MLSVFGWPVFPILIIRRCIFFGGGSKREEAELQQGIKREVQEMRDKDRSYFF